MIASVGAGGHGDTAAILATNLGAHGWRDAGRLEEQRHRSWHRQPFGSIPQVELAADLSILVKDRIMCELRIGVPLEDSSGEFGRQRDLYEADLIDVGIVLLPTKAMASSMPSGVVYYEGEVSSLLRHGRGTPAVPLVLIGIAPD